MRQLLFLLGVIPAIAQAELFVFDDMKAEDNFHLEKKVNAPGEKKEQFSRKDEKESPAPGLNNKVQNDVNTSNLIEKIAISGVEKSSIHWEFKRDERIDRALERYLLTQGIRLDWQKNSFLYLDEPQIHIDAQDTQAAVQEILRVFGLTARLENERLTVID